MKMQGKYWLIVVIAVLLFSVLSCSSPLKLFATPTSTPTNTATFTPTFTRTATFTATVEPPIDLFGCTYNECPLSKTINDYLGENNYPAVNVETPLTIPWTDTVHFYYSWCAVDQATLQDNLQKLEFYFTINDVSYINYLQDETFEVPDSTDPSLTQACYGIGGIASGWQIGEFYQVKIGTRMTSYVNDGWNDFAAGSDIGYIFGIVPTELPTETPSPTATATPRPTNTYVPQSVEPSCMVNSNIRIDNRTDGAATLFLTGPGSFTFSLPQGSNTVLVCSGSYDYTISGTCGGSAASGMGRISDGDDIYFYCQ